MPDDEHAAPEPDDLGGVAFDDDFDDEAPTDAAERGPGDRGAPAYDSGTILQSRNIAYPDTTPAGMVALQRFVLGRWKGANLGCLSKPPRTMRGGGSPSLHNWGMAWDWRWADPGPGRPTADAVIEFCLTNTAVLGIQAVHDYERCRYWKSYSGWKNATKSASTGFGQSWAQWLHIERTWAAANDGRSIDAVLADAGTAVDDDGPVVTDGHGAVRLPDPVLEEGDTGANVALLQDFLRRFGFADYDRSDGRFGPRTRRSVMNAQQAFAAKGLYRARIDGEYGPRSAAAAAQFVAAAVGG